MFTRNKLSWTSIVKSTIWLPAIAIFLLSGTAQAQWTLIENFEDQTVGVDVNGLTSPGAVWDGGSLQHSVQVDPADAENVAMRVNGTPGNAVLRGNFSAPSTNIAFGATGTLFYRFRTPVAATGTTDHVIGLTDNPAIGNFDFKSGLRNIVPAGANTLDLRDGLMPGYEEVATLADDTWYLFWMVSVNTNPGTFEGYLQSETDPNFATQTLVVGTQTDAFDYRVNGDTDIINVYFRNANNSGGITGNDLYFDDIYVNPTAEDLTDPRPTDSVLLGDANCDGTVDFLDIAPFIDILTNGTFKPEADIDGSTVVDFLDIAPFIQILTS